MTNDHPAAKLAGNEQLRTSVEGLRRCLNQRNKAQEHMCEVAAHRTNGALGDVRRQCRSYAESLDQVSSRHSLPTEDSSLVPMRAPLKIWLGALAGLLFQPFSHGLSPYLVWPVLILADVVGRGLVTDVVAAATASRYWHDESEDVARSLKENIELGRHNVRHWHKALGSLNWLATCRAEMLGAGQRIEHRFQQGKGVTLVAGVFTIGIVMGLSMSGEAALVWFELAAASGTVAGVAMMGTAATYIRSVDASVSTDEQTMRRLTHAVLFEQALADGINQGWEWLAISKLSPVVNERERQVLEAVDEVTEADKEVQAARSQVRRVLTEVKALLRVDLSSEELPRVLAELAGPVLR